VSFLSELKRRNVFRVGAAYLTLGWVVIQATATLTPALHLPESALPLVTWIGVVGLPFVIAFAWIYELTPDGLKREHEIDRRHSITHVTGKRLDYVVIALLAVAIALFLVNRFLPRDDSPSTVPRLADASAEAVDTTLITPATRAGAPSGKSIAVLPFVNMSGDPENEYFADGLAEELLNLLAKIPDLRVAARTSAFKFKGEKIDLQEVAQELNVANVLEGSVRKSGNRIRITAQLISAADGYHVWSETYDRTLDDIFVVQDEIAGAVVEELRGTLLGPAFAARSKPKDPEAYNLVLQGRYFVERNGRKDLEHAIDYFRQALQRDPGFAPAWAGLSSAYSGQSDSGLVPIADGNRRAREAAQKALELDPSLSEAHLAMGWIYNGYDWNWAAADASFRRALALAPGSAQAFRALGIQAAAYGRWDESLEMTNKAIERDPLGANAYQNLALVLMATNRDAEAESALRKAQELRPAGPGQHASIARVLLLRGRYAAALLEVQQEEEEIWRLSILPLAYHALGRRSDSAAALATFKSRYHDEMAYQIAEAHAFRGEVDLAFEWLERAYEQRDAGITEIKGDRFIRPLNGDPRYETLLEKLKLPK
jgi:TolB-like protein/Tfp pilus assembly protein PilF